MADPIYKFCPLCATELIKQNVQHVLRPCCPACGFIQFRNPKVVAVVALQFEEKLLLARRNIEPRKGHWNFCGGYVELGETLEEAATREVKEEAGLDVHIGKLIGVYCYGGEMPVMVAFHAPINSDHLSSLAAQPEEVSELALFARGEMPEFAFPVHYEIVQDWERLLDQGAF